MNTSTQHRARAREYTDASCGPAMTAGVRMHVAAGYKHLAQKEQEFERRFRDARWPLGKTSNGADASFDGVGDMAYEFIALSQERLAERLRSL